MSTDVETLEAELLKWRIWFNKGSRGWSFAFHLTAYGAVFTSSLATYVAQSAGDPLPGVEREHLTALLALVTTILAAIAAAGGFERKWRSSRLSRSRIDMLLLDLRMSNRDPQAIQAHLKRIVEEHDIAILGLLGSESRDAPPGSPAASTQGTPPPGRPGTP